MAEHWSRKSVALRKRVFSILQNAKYLEPNDNATKLLSTQLSMTVFQQCLQRFIFYVFFVIFFFLQIGPIRQHRLSHTVYIRSAITWIQIAIFKMILNTNSSTMKKIEHFSNINILANIFTMYYLFLYSYFQVSRITNRIDYAVKLLNNELLL
jgi:hypothetical protein